MAVWVLAVNNYFFSCAIVEKMKRPQLLIKGVTQPLCTIFSRLLWTHEGESGNSKQMDT